MKKYFILAYRNTVRHKRRTILTVFLIASVVAVTIFMEGFLEAYNQGWLQATIHSETGHIQIMPTGYREAAVMAPIEGLIASPEKIKELIEEDKDVIGITERLKIGGMIATEEKTAIFSGVGIDLVNEYDVFDLIDVQQGRRLSPLDKEGCVIGALLAKQLGLKVGDSATLIANTIEGAMNAVRIHIVGIFESGTPEVDSLFIYIPIIHAQNLVNTPGQVSNIILLLNDIKKVEPYSKRLKEMIETIGMKQSVEVWRWDELAGMFKRITNMQRFQLSVVEGVMLFLVVLSIVIIMLMSIFERVREIGTLTAFGITRREIATLFLTESAMLGLLGGFMGNMIGLIVTTITYYLGIPFNPPGSTMTVYIRPIIVPQIMMILFFVAILTTLLGGLYPALWGSKIKPTEALRYV